MKKLITVILIGVSFTSCTDHARSFINKFENEDFTEFKNAGIHFRGADQEGNHILMVSETLQNNIENNRGPIVGKVDRKTNEIKETSLRLLRDSSNVDVAKAKQLALKFLPYKVFGLTVDSNLHVFVMLYETDRGPHLARFSEPEYLKTADVFKRKWRHLRGKWHKAKD